MPGDFPWVLAALVAGVIVVIATCILYRKNQVADGERIFDRVHKKIFLTQFTLGILCSLGGAFLMFNGELLGENTTGIARVVGIIGIGLIATASPIGIAVKKRPSAK